MKSPLIRSSSSTIFTKREKSSILEGDIPEFWSEDFLNSRESERDEAAEEADPIGKFVAEEAASEGEGVPGGSVWHGRVGGSEGCCSRPRQPLCRRRGCSCDWDCRPHLQAGQGENLRW